MSQFSFVNGERIRMNNELYHLRRKLGSGKWQLEKDANGAYVVMEEAELLELYHQKLVSFVSSYMDNTVENSVVENKIAKNFADYPEKFQLEAKRRLKYIKSIEGVAGNAAKEEISKTAKGLGIAVPPDISTVYRWAKKLQNSGKNICSLLPNYSRCGNRRPRFPEEVIEIAVSTIRKIYMNDNRNSENETISAIRDAVEAENCRRSPDKKLPKPQRKFLRNILAALDAYEVTRARYGKNAASKNFREVNTSGEIIKEPLERVEIDHTILDLIIVSAESYLPLGRPTITIAFDRCTRCICGYHVGYDPPSYVSIMKCMAHAIKPKEYVRTKYPAIENNWPCWGIPRLLVVDNGMEFHSKDLEAAALSLLIDIRYCPAGQPWWKGAVERFFRTMGKALIHRVPGATFSNIQDKGDYSSIKNAVMTETDLHELLHTWICDVYHQTIHRATLRTPNSLWLERISSTSQTLPSSVEMLDVSLSSIEHRTVFHYGVSLNNLNYNSSELQKLRRKYGELNLQVRWDHSNLEFVHILDEVANVYLKVPCTWRNYATGMSLWLHKAIRNEALAQEGPESEAKLDAAKARIRTMYEKAMANKKLVTRKTAARAQPSFAHDTPAGTMSIADIGIVPVKNEIENPSDFDVDGEQEDDIPNYEVIDRPK